MMRAQTRKYVAFLRGINVGGSKLVKMDELRKAFESMGFQNVKTLIASGNVLFETTAAPGNTLVTKIENKMKAVFGHDIGVLLRDIDGIQEIVDSDPFKGVKITPDVKLYVTFLAEKSKNALKLPYESPRKDFRIIRVAEREVFSISTPLPEARSADWMKTIEKEFGKRVTTRNWNTILRILKTK